MTDHDLSHIFGDLIETVKGGAEGYRRAAAAVGDPDLESTLLCFAAQRGDFARDLQKLADRFCAVAAAGRTDLVPRLERGWNQLAAAVASASPNEILTACRHGDEHTLESYDDAIALSLPEAAHATLRAHATEVRATIKKIVHLCELTHAGRV